MKIGIYGGTFNPFHKGHLYIVEAVRREYGLDRIFVIPTYISPNKIEDNNVSAEHRISMCRLALSGQSGVEVSDYEIKQGQVSYSYLTVTHFKELYPNDELYFIMGADSLDYFGSWKHPEIIASKASILVLMREGFENASIRAKSVDLRQSLGADIKFLHCDNFDASSSQIRKSLSEDRTSCPEQLQHSVYDYIVKNNLYEG